jgi:hypothetical protein
MFAPAGATEIIEALIVKKDIYYFLKTVLP